MNSSAAHLVTLVPAQPVTELDDRTLRDELVALENLRNAAEARQSELMVAMHERAEQQEAARDAALAPSVLPIVPAGRLTEFVVDELAALLACTRVAASSRFTVALQAFDCQPLQAAWRSGQVDARKVAEIASAPR
jgi:hypothetical protein